MYRKEQKKPFIYYPILIRSVFLFRFFSHDSFLFILFSFVPNTNHHHYYYYYHHHHQNEPVDDFILETVVSSNEILSDLNPESIRAYEEPRLHGGTGGETFGVHNAYVAIGTLAAAIMIVAVVVGCMKSCGKITF
jgi:hypothetical protein